MRKVREEAYLTKKTLVSAAKRGFRKAARETIAVMGYNVIVEDGWVVKKFPDGSISKIKKLQTERQKLVLD
jgi:hypothetical protein